MPKRDSRLFRASEFWCSVTPHGDRSRQQGWKLHMSAAQLAAPLVLARAAEVLVRDGCAFKFTRGLNQLADLLPASVTAAAAGADGSLADRSWVYQQALTLLRPIVPTKNEA
jgi:hypothetical protein